VFALGRAGLCILFWYGGKIGQTRSRCQIKDYLCPGLRPRNTRESSKPTNASSGSETRGEHRTANEETHWHGCSDRGFGGRVLGPGSGCAIQLLLAVKSAVERDHVGIVSSDTGHSKGLVAGSNTQRSSLRRHCGFNAIPAQVHPSVCRVSHLPKPSPL
jgi:hypothetical protein